MKNFNTKGPLTLSAKKYGGLSFKKGEGRVRAGAKPLIMFNFNAFLNVNSVEVSLYFSELIHQKTISVFVEFVI